MDYFIQEILNDYVSDLEVLVLLEHFDSIFPREPPTLEVGHNSFLLNL